MPKVIAGAAALMVRLFGNKTEVFKAVVHGSNAIEDLAVISIDIGALNAIRKGNKRFVPFPNSDFREHFLSAVSADLEAGL